MTSLNGCLAAVNDSKTKTDRFQQYSTHSGIKHYLAASVQPRIHTLGTETPPATSQASHNIAQTSLRAHDIRGSSHSGAQSSSRWLRQSSGKDTQKTSSPTNNFDPMYFATSSWSFPTPAAIHPEPAAPLRSGATLSKTPALRCEESAGTSPIPGRSSSTTHGPHLFPPPTMMELTDDDDSADDGDLASWMLQDIEDEIRRSSFASSTSRAATSRRSSIVAPRNLPVTSPFVSLDAFTYRGIPLAERVYVELKDRDFLRIVDIIQDRSMSAVTLRGWKFRRTREMNGLIDRKLNEVCWILHIDDDDPRDARIQGMETVPVCEVVKRRCIRLTNQSFPALSWRDDGKKETPETIENDRVLVCRFKYLCSYADAKARTSYKWSEKGFHRLREDECDQRVDNNVRDDELRSIWRGHTVPGGAQEGWLPGEREFLRQEDVSHKGIASRSSLKAPSGLNFAMGDPMKRGDVGSLRTEYDLRRSPGQTKQSTNIGNKDLVHTDGTIMSRDDVEEVSTSPNQPSREQRQDLQKSDFNFAGLNSLLIDSSDHDTVEDEGCDMFTLRQRLRQSSVQPRKSINKSPRIVEIDAHVKMSSRSGTFEKRYEGKITSRFYPTPRLTQSKRSADMSFGSPARSTKRVDRGHRTEPHRGNLLNGNDRRVSQASPICNWYSHQEPASSDSDRTLGRSHSPEIYTPSKSMDYNSAVSGLLTPVSRRRKSSMLRRRKDTLLSPGTSGLTEHMLQSTPSSRAARSSVLNQHQTYRLREDADNLVDLTRPQVNPNGSFSGACPPNIFQSGPSTPLYGCSSLSSNLDKIASSVGETSRPTSVLPPPRSKCHWTATEMRRSSKPISPGSLPVTPRSPRAYRMLPHRRFETTRRPSLRPTAKSRQQNQSTTINAFASKANQRRYTFGDCFCGAGGMSRGAVSAGLRVHWGFDFNLAACQTYAMNFFGTPIYNVWANQFSEARGDHKVDICHLSPPCQFFSDAHTIQGKDDDMNTASLFAIFNLLEKAKPRVVTLEQTSGLIRRHPIFFNAVINMFTSRGFSVRWKVMNCADFGLPQRRTRLFILASW